MVRHECAHTHTQNKNQNKYYMKIIWSSNWVFIREGLLYNNHSHSCTYCLCWFCFITAELCGGGRENMWQAMSQIFTILVLYRRCLLTPGLGCGRGWEQVCREKRWGEQSVWSEFCFVLQFNPPRSMVSFDWFAYLFFLFSMLHTVYINKW